MGKEATGWQRFQRDIRKLPAIPLAILLLIVLVALTAPFITPYSPYEGSLGQQLRPPFWQESGSMAHILGTDRLGRDILSRLIEGARISVVIGLIGVLIPGVLGSFLGLLSGYYGGLMDSVVMRLADITFSLQSILLAMILAILFGPSFANVLVVTSLVLWARFARMSRGETLSVKEREFVSLARLAGCSNLRIMLTHILPNIVNSLVVLATLNVGFVILLEASLSFLGAGIPAPTPSWGLMVSDGRGLIATAWWVSVVPGSAILCIVLAINLLGDKVRDLLDPTLRNV